MDTACTRTVPAFNVACYLASQLLKDASVSWTIPSFLVFLSSGSGLYVSMSEWVNAHRVDTESQVMIMSRDWGREIGETRQTKSYTGEHLYPAQLHMWGMHPCVSVYIWFEFNLNMHADACPEVKGHHWRVLRTGNNACHQPCKRTAYCMHAVVFLSMQQCKGLGNHSCPHTGGVRASIVLHLWCVALPYTCKLGISKKNRSTNTVW
jgi:hypothetical protein